MKTEIKVQVILRNKLDLNVKDIEIKQSIESRPRQNIVKVLRDKCKQTRIGILVWSFLVKQHSSEQ